MLPNYLANIKSSGIYRFVFDKSEMPGQEAETLRLVIGYSEKGPFNTPVYVKTEDEFKKIYGGTSKKMERYGMWFHRMALQALKAGPILAFNLKNFEGNFKGDGINEVEYTTFNPNEPIFRIDDEVGFADNLTMAIKDLYNTDRFWTLEPEQLEEYVNDRDEEDSVNFPKGYITIAATDSKDTSVTIFMRGYEPKGYDVPFMEWYSAVLNGAEMPSYLEGHERDLVSQYWAELFIFKGQFTPEIAASDKLAKFFIIEDNHVFLKPYIINAFGEKIDTLDALAANDASNFIKKYTGILLPDFRNANNTVISLDAQVNGDNYVHKLMMRFNQDMLYSIDPTDEDGFQLSDIDTTGWSQGPEYHHPMMSLITTLPIIFTATFDGEQWNYDEGEHAGESADYYRYVGLEEHGRSTGYNLFLDESTGFAQSGIHEGDSIFAGILTHVVKISKTKKEDPYWTINGKGHYENEPGIEHYTPEGTWYIGGNKYSNDYNGGVTPVKLELIEDQSDEHYNYYRVYNPVTGETVADINGDFHYFYNDPFKRVKPAWNPVGRDGVWADSSRDFEYSCDYNGGGAPVMMQQVTDPNSPFYEKYIVVDPNSQVEVPDLNGNFNVYDSYYDFKWEQLGQGCWMCTNNNPGICYNHDYNKPLKGVLIDDSSDPHYNLWKVDDANQGFEVAAEDGEYHYFSDEPKFEWIQERQSHWMVDDMMYTSHYDKPVKLVRIEDENDPNYGKYMVADKITRSEVKAEDGEYHYFDMDYEPAWVRLIDEHWMFEYRAWLTEPSVEEHPATYIFVVQLDRSTDDGVDISDGIFKCVGSVSATSAFAMPLYLQGYTYGNPKPATTKMYDKWQWQKYMLNALTEYKGLRIALTSRVDLEYRYLVDTFEGFVEPECKAMLSILCKEKDNAFAILNFPAIKTFSKSHQQGGPSFRNERNEFDTKYIAMGGNPLKPMPMMFTLPSQENGASWCGFFTALKIRDINTGVKEDVPSAALVSNNFMKKYTTYLPYTVIAGTNRGIVREQGLLGPDFNFSREDLDNLEPFGVNCMVYVDRKGTCINSNQTAKQNPVTTLSKISTRELVIFLQDEIEKLLLDYHWDFNTPNLQQRIKDRADVILETAKNNGGVYDYHNQCDEYNNTDDVINNEMFVLSTSIEPGMGAGKMVQELYIYRKGGMSSALLSDTGA